MGPRQKLVAIGLLFLAALATGIWRRNAGRPAIASLLHKLLGLAWVIYTAVVVYHAERPIDSGAAFFAAIAVLAVSNVALIATASLLTLPQQESSARLNLHRIASVTAAIACGVTLRLLM